MFVMRHRTNSMSASISTTASRPENIWFVDSCASNHMTSHQEWFRDLREPDRPGYVETEDDITHPIQHIGNVPFVKEGNQTYIKNVLHMPPITKNLALTPNCGVKDASLLNQPYNLLHWERGSTHCSWMKRGRMFTLDLHEMKSTMITKSPKANTDIELWHKRIGHMNLNKVKGMQSKGAVIGLPTFKEKEMSWTYTKTPRLIIRIRTHELFKDNVHL